jgi:tetratricopeptide (TPR) repeat protein
VVELPRDGEVLGRYAVLETIGTGGMGVVLAAWDRKLDRKVALKLLRTDKVGDGQRRMLREARLLGQLQHEHVVTVFDVGTYQGQVYIAMEYVEGATLDAWIQAEAPRWPEILDVVIRAGRGLAAAHAAGLVHRDFKPGNVLVGPRPDSGQRPVRVVDFGIAIVAGRPGTELPPQIAIDSLDGGTEVRASLRAGEPLTESGAMLGTPAYMAPEQHLGRAADATSDQFSFCVALYRSLYGERPFAGHTLAVLKNEVLRGRVRSAPSASRVPRWLRRIVLRGLEADPRRRFPSMTALLDTLERTQSARRRIPLAAAAFAGIALAGWGAIVDVASPSGPRCDDASARLSGAWDDARRGAVAAAFGKSDLPYAADAAQRVSRQLDDWAASWSSAHEQACLVGEHEGAGGSEALDARMTCLRRRLAEVAALTEELSAADDAVIERATAALAELPPVTDCVDAHEHGAPRAPPELAAEVDDVRQVLVAFDAAHSAGRFERARTLAADALVRAESTGFLPLVAECRWRLGMAFLALGRLAEAEEALGTATLDATAAGDDEAAARVATKLAFVVGYRQARPDEGLAWARHAEAALERVGGGTLLEADLLVTLGAIRMSRGEFAEARVAFERALELRIERLGEDHPHVAAVHNNLGAALLSLDEPEGARAQLERALGIWEDVHGPEHPHFATGLTGLGVAYEKTGELDAARRAHERAVSVKERTFGPDHDSVATSLDNLASVLLALGQHDASREPSLRALAIREKALGPDHPEVASSLVNLGLAHEHERRFDEAIDAQSRAVRIFEAALGAEHPHLAHPLTSLGRCRLAKGDVQHARDALERALKIRDHAGASGLERAETRFALALALDAEGPRGMPPADRAAAVALAEVARAELAGARGDEPTLARLAREIAATLREWHANTD